MNRRQILRLTTLFGACALAAPGALAISHPAEQFPIDEADVDRVPEKFRRQAVSYSGPEKPGTIVVDTANRYLYLVQPNGEALRYGIGIGRQGFSWSGRADVRWKAKWPRWTPPAKMVKRDPAAAKWANGMPGGPTNPLGARALYLFQGKVDTLYRIHGTADPRSIGRAVSSGCIRLLNADVADLYERVKPGAQVVVKQGGRKQPERAAPRLEAREEPRQEKMKPKAPIVQRNFNLN
ncbi:L,D-transpeptidase [Nordella sp. HKS 07]|nr:L,D-transpeptidase [Nordella sp. HKS 07]QIG51556.1 L,D-transpeptidase [Nordella sp. HKS 07]